MYEIIQLLFIIICIVTLVSTTDDIIKASSWYNQRVNPNLRDKEG